MDGGDKEDEEVVLESEEEVQPWAGYDCTFYEQYHRFFFWFAIKEILEMLKITELNCITLKKCHIYDKHYVFYFIIMSLIF